MDDLLRFDQNLFHLINGKWHNSILDTVLPFVRASQFWIPLYVFLLVYAIVNFKKKAFWWVLFAAMTAMLGDFISSDIIKENIHRLRPCREPAFADSVRFIVSYCPKSSSFTSSHAVNHFAMATFFFITLRNLWGHWAKAFYLWAFIIIYAQVYVGVHYPLDVLSGAIIGSLIGMTIAYAFNKNYNLVD